MIDLNELREMCNEIECEECPFYDPEGRNNRQCYFSREVPDWDLDDIGEKMADMRNSFHRKIISDDEAKSVLDRMYRVCSERVGLSCDFDLCDTCPIQGACRMLDGMPADMIEVQKNE